LIGGVDWRAYKNDVSLEGTPIGDEVRVHPLSLGWSGLLPLASSGQLALQLTGVRNPDGHFKFPHPWPPQIPPGKTAGL
jgi:hypothetical protein